MKVPEDYDKTLTAYIYEFIEKTVPQVSKGYKNDSEHLTFTKNDEKGIDGFDGSKQERNINAKFKDGKVKSVSTNTKNSFSQKKDHQMSTTENNFTEQLSGSNKYVTRESPIKSYEESLESTLTLESSDVDETLTKKIDDYVNSKKLKDYEKDEKRRLELNEYNSKLSSKNQLRNLDYIVTEPWREPFTFNYPLFNIDFLGAEIGLIAQVAFKPMLGQFEVQIYYNKNSEEPELVGEKRIYTNFDKVINAVDQVIDQLNALIEGNIVLKIKKIYDEYIGYIDTNLETLFESINSVPDFSDVFQQPLEELFLTIRNAGSISYNKIFNNLTSTINLFDQIQNEINAKTEPHLKNILDASDANIDEFLYNHVSDASNIYEASKVYYSGVVEAINTRLEILKQNKSHTFDFDITTFYDIKDIYTKVLNIFTNLNQRILDAISVERINFVNKVNEQFDLILNDPLKDIEQISYDARNKASIIDAFNIFYGSTLGEQNRK